MADVIYKKGQSSNLNNVQIKEGQILVTEDTGEMYIDVTDNDRKKINAIADQTYAPTSENAQSGKAVAEAVAPKANKTEVDKLKEDLRQLSDEITKIPSGKDGADGKSAYQYAVEGGYTGTEAELSAKLAQEQLTGTTYDLTPTQVYDAVSAGITVKVQYTDSTYGLLSFTAFNIAESLNVIVSQMIVNYNDVYILAALNGNKSDNTWGTAFTTLAQKTDIPSALPNSNALTIKIGSTTVTYDGSTAQTVTIADGSEVSY